MAIQGVLQQLRMAGHPDHQSTPEDRVYNLARGVQHLEDTAANLRQLFASWQDHIQAVHDTYHATLFLSTHQLVVASGLLRTLQVDGVWASMHAASRSAFYCAQLLQNCCHANYIVRT